MDIKEKYQLVAAAQIAAGNVAEAWITHQTSWGGNLENINSHILEITNTLLRRAIPFARAQFQDDPINVPLVAGMLIAASSTTITWVLHNPALNGRDVNQLVMITQENFEFLLKNRRRISLDPLD